MTADQYFYSAQPRALEIEFMITVSCNLKVNFCIYHVITRSLENRLNRALDSMPVVALFGPRQVGKTTLTLEIAGKRLSPFNVWELHQHGPLGFKVNKFWSGADFLLSIKPTGRVIIHLITR